MHRRVSEIVGRVSGLRGRQPFDPLTPQNAAKAIDEIKIDEGITGIVSILEQLFATTRRLVLVSDSQGSLARAARPIPGQASFSLYDAHGFPLELTQQIAEENGFEVDEKGFHEEMESQRDRGRASSRFMQDDDFGFSYDDLNGNGQYDFGEPYTLMGGSEIYANSDLGDYDADGPAAQALRQRR